MQQLHWRQVPHGDEYAEVGDTHVVDAPSGAYYYNASRKVVRRYKDDFSYAEIRVRSRPAAGQLSGMFGQAKRDGRLRAVEPGQPEPLAA